MIYINEHLIEPKTFPDGTSSLQIDIADLDPFSNRVCNVTWKYDNEAECMLLWNLIHHIRSCRMSKNFEAIKLYLPYIPNARMDRVEDKHQIFTLKWFAEFLNSLRFDEVLVIDPHSNVSVALIDNCEWRGIDQYITKAETEIGCSNLLRCYPDAGAAKRYSRDYSVEYVYGVKQRNWFTGEITKFELTHPEIVNGRNVLIVDDICSKGGTFMHTARALKEAGAEKIYLYVTHCENTIFQGELLKTDLIDHIFTTDSIYRGNHDKITVLEENE